MVRNGIVTYQWPEMEGYTYENIMANTRANPLWECWVDTPRFFVRRDLSSVLIREGVLVLQIWIPNE